MEQNNKISITAKLFESTAQYFDGTLQRYSLSGGTVSLRNSSARRSNITLLVVAKQFYLETQKHYPTDDLATLKKILNIEARKSGGFYDIADISEAGSRVNWWFFDESVPKALVTVPETYLLAQNLMPSDVILLTDENQQIYVKKVNKLIYSAFKSKLLSDHMRFSASIGTVDSANCIELDADQTVQRVFFSLIANKAKCVQKFSRLPSRAYMQRRLVPLSIIALTCISLYFVLTSVYLNVQNNALEQALADKRPVIDKILAEQNRYDELLAFNDNVTAVTEQVERTSYFWAIIAEYFDDVTFTNVRKVNERYIIRGSTGKATDLLERISQHTFVHDAKFDFPTRSGKEAEIFVISFKITGPNEAYFLEKPIAAQSEVEYVE